MLNRLFTEEFLGLYARAEARARRALVDDAGDMQKQLERAAHQFLAIAEAVDALVKKTGDFVRRIRNGEFGNFGNEILHMSDDEPSHSQMELPEGNKVIVGDFLAIANSLKLAYKILEDLQERAEAPSAAILSHGAAKPDPSWNVEEVNDWWTSLSVEERQKIEVMHPDWIGNLGGVPFDVRDRANRRRINPMLSDINKRIAQAQEHSLLRGARHRYPRRDQVVHGETKAKDPPRKVSRPTVGQTQVWGIVEAFAFSSKLRHGKRGPSVGGGRFGRHRQRRPRHGSHPGNDGHRRIPSHGQRQRLGIGRLRRRQRPR